MEKIVSKPCLTAADLPTRPTPTAVDISRASTAQLAAAVSIDARKEREYQQQLEAVIQSCLH